MKSLYKLADCAVFMLILLIVSGLLTLAGGGSPTHGSSGDEQGENSGEDLSPTDMSTLKVKL